MKNTIKRTLFGLFCVVMAYVFVACSNGEPPFIPVVNYTEEEVSSSVNEIPAGTYKIYHLRQKTTGGTQLPIHSTLTIKVRLKTAQKQKL